MEETELVLGARKLRTIRKLCSTHPPQSIPEKLKRIEAVLSTGKDPGQRMQPSRATRNRMETGGTDRAPEPAEPRNVVTTQDLS